MSTSILNLTKSKKKKKKKKKKRKMTEFSKLDMKEVLKEVNPIIEASDEHDDGTPKEMRVDSLRKSEVQKSPQKI